MLSVYDLERELSERDFGCARACVWCTLFWDWYATRLAVSIANENPCGTRYDGSADQHRNDQEYRDHPRGKVEGNHVESDAAIVPGAANGQERAGIRR
jgi:hypothetical protein